MEKSIEIDGLKLAYNETGPEHAEPIILMHGWGCNSSTLASVERLVNTKYHTYNLDLPGFGKTPEPPTVWGVEEYTRLVEKFIDKLGIRKPILFGHSFGGRLTLLMSSRHPEIGKIILTDAAGIKPKRSLKYYLKIYSFKALKKIAPLLLGKERGNKLIEKRRAKAGSSDYNQASPRMKAILSKCVNEDLTHVLPDIKASALLIWGEDDTATPLSDARLMEKRIPDAGLVAFANCGHYSFLDNPGGFRAVMSSFLKL